MKCPATQLTLKRLRKDGWPLVAVVERWNAFARIRQDLWGFDVLACNRDGVLGVQCTSKANMSARRKKLLANPALALWCESPTRRAEIWGWFKQDGRWQVRIEEVRPV